MKRWCMMVFLISVSSDLSISPHLGVSDRFCSLALVLDRSIYLDEQDIPKT